MIKHPLSPIICKESRVLILGSFPSVISRKEEFYYANPNNRFWKVLEILFEEEIKNREEFICKHHLALWDVIASCDIEGSSDASICNVLPNPILELLQNYPIELIVLNGKTAEKLFKKYFPKCEVETITCPSTSSANARCHLDDLVKAYYRIKVVNDEKN
ncbi:DNA-deoxyinosine glycosylase [Anaerorhabdus sp.]|uniref:DNA-deoxyinosine glycosylase n=1 Tax=Anaerorhabdus sp. TaxID=1872524 RepID=UPI002FC64B50